MLIALKNFICVVIPAPVLSRILSAYHLFLALCGAVLYGYPSRSMLVIGVTGTKGKSTVTEMLDAILEESGHITCLMNSIRFKIGTSSKPNLTRMSMPGRFFIQKFLYDARRSGCTAAILEMTSEGARQHRHRYIDLNALIFTNLAPEHIESHGSYEAYAAAKLEIGRQLVRSVKRPRIMVANAEDKESTRYLTLPVEYALPFSISSTNASADEHGGRFTFDEQEFTLHLPGMFSLKNALAAATLARALGMKGLVIARALEKLTRVPGRAERIEAGQNFTVVVDYAHTPDSLTAIYDAYSQVKKICVLGSMGGGRDTWKRPIMGAIAEKRCAHVILTDEDPCDEDPQQIVEDLAHGMSKKPEIILDRRLAIRHALGLAQKDDAVLITGKGTNHEILGPRGSMTPWSDAQVAGEELAALLRKNTV